MNITGKTILVTGGAGFIGSNLTEALLNYKNNLVCLDNFSTGKRENIASFLEDENYTLIEGDIRNPEDCKKAVKNVDIIMHQAALGSVPRSINDPGTSTEVNVSGFVNIMFAAKEAGVKRIVYASSSSVYGDHPGLPKKEELVGTVLSPYAATKKADEIFAEVFSKVYDLELVGLRYFNVFGKRQDPEGAYAAVIPRFVKLMIDKKAPLVHGDGEQSRDFTYIDNVIQANILAGTTTNPKALNQVYNVAYSANTTVNDLFFTLRKLLSKYDSTIDDLVPEYGSVRPGDVRHSHADISKAVELLGYKPQFDIQAGLEKAIDWYWNDLNSEQ